MRVIVFGIYVVSIMVGCKCESGETGSNDKPNIVISAAADDQSNRQIVADGSGGAIITWYDYRSGAYDIYAQGLSASGRQ